MIDGIQHQSSGFQTVLRSPLRPTVVRKREGRTGGNSIQDPQNPSVTSVSLSYNQHVTKYSASTNGAEAKLTLTPDLVSVYIDS